MLNHDDEIILISDAARILDVSTAAVRAMERRGLIAPVRSGRRGVRLFKRHDVEQLAKDRAASRARTAA